MRRVYSCSASFEGDRPMIDFDLPENMRNDWLTVGRVFEGALPAAVWPPWAFMITITGAFRGVAAASAGAALAGVRTPPSRAPAVAGTARTYKTPRFAMLSSSGKAARAAATRETVTESIQRVTEAPIFRVARAPAAAPRHKAA